MPDVVYVLSDGTVKGEQRIRGTFYADFNLSNFPRDSQMLPITVISTKYGPNELKFNLAYMDINRIVGEKGWFVTKSDFRSSVYSLELLEEGKGNKVRTNYFTRFDIEFEVKRHVKYYIWKVFIPLCIIVFAAMAVFWVDPTQLPVQTGIGTAMLLTVIAFLFSLQTILPKINYLTRMDVFVYSSLVFVFATFIEGVTTCNLAAHGKVHLARKIDKFARVIFPLAFLSVIVWFWS